MPIKIIGSPEPRYLAATDILISDMSNIIYDFLLFNRPIILIANDWVKANVPDLGIKTDIEDFEQAIIRAMDNPGKFEKERKYWLDKTMNNPDGNSSCRVADRVLEKSGTTNPYVVLIYNNEVSKIHLLPLYNEFKKRLIEVALIKEAATYDFKEKNKNIIFIATHNKIFFNLSYGFRVHIDHSVRGPGTTDIGREAELFKSWDYCVNTDLHITEGEISFNSMKMFMGPLSERVMMVGYPKSDVLLKLNNIENKNRVFSELGFDINKILVTYAPTGKYSYPFKLGASYCKDILKTLKRISKKYDFNILIKLRSEASVIGKVKGKLVKMITRKRAVEVN